MIFWALAKGSEPKREYKLLMLPLNEEVFFFFFDHSFIKKKKKNNLDKLYWQLLTKQIKRYTLGYRITLQ